MKLYDQKGDECQMTGLPHTFYDKVAVDERIAELEKALRELIRSHQGYAMGLGPCICAAHENARRLLGISRDL